MLPTPIEGLERPDSGPLLDRFGRRHTYVRISVTDACNYRCTYCAPAGGFGVLPRRDWLSPEEIGRLVGVLAGCGVDRVRLTGGEPTLRGDLDEIVGRVAAVPGIRDVAMTTNGHLFAPRASALAVAGLRRVNISLDSLDPERFARMTRGGDLSRVLAAIEAAREEGLTPIKINVVVVGGENDDEVWRIMEHFSPHAADTIVRFIEYMPFSGNPGAGTHVPAAVLRERIAARSAMVDEPASGGGPAVYVRLMDSGLRVGFISPITEHFCQSCNRLRIQADGHLRSCLSREPQPSLRDLLRNGVSDVELERVVRERVWGKVAGHEAHRAESRAFEGVMTQIGG